jgi:hypothetical protein
VVVRRNVLSRLFSRLFKIDFVTLSGSLLYSEP